MPQVDEFGRAIPSVGDNDNDAAAAASTTGGQPSSLPPAEDGNHNHNNPYHNNNPYNNNNNPYGGPRNNYRDIESSSSSSARASSSLRGRYNPNDSHPPQPRHTDNSHYSRGNSFPPGASGSGDPFDRPLSASRDGPSSRSQHWRSNSPPLSRGGGDRGGGGRPGSGRRGGNYHHPHHPHHHGGGGGSHRGDHHRGGGGGGGPAAASAPPPPPHPSQRYVTDPMLCEFLWKEAQEKKSSNNNTNNGADSSSNTNETTESSGDPQEPNSTKEEQAQPDAGDDDNNNMEETGEGPSSDATTIKTSESYDDYRLSYAWTFLKHFFNQHLDDSWFRQQYSPALLVAKATLERKRCHAEAVLLRQQVLSNVETTTKSQQEFMANVSLTVPSGGSLSSSLHNNSNHHGASGSFISMTQQPSPPQVPAQHLCDAFHRTLHIHHVPSHVNDEHLLQTLLPLLTDCYSLEQEKRNKKSSSSSQTAPSGGTKKKKTNYSPQEVMENCLLGLFSSTPHNSNHKRDAGLSGGAMHSTAVTPPRRGGSSVFLHRSVFCVCTTTEVCDGLWQLLIQRTANPEDPNHHHSKEGNNDPAHNNNNNNNNMNNTGNPNEGTSSSGAPDNNHNTNGAHVPRKQETAHLNSPFHDLEVDCTDPYGRTEYDANGQGGAPPDGLAIPPRKAVLSISRYQAPVHNAVTLSAALSSPGRFPSDQEAATTMARALDVRQHVPMEDRLDSILEQAAPLINSLSEEQANGTNEEGGPESETTHKAASNLVLDITLAYLRRVHLYSFYKTTKAESFGDVLAGTSVAAQVQLREQVDPEFNEPDKEDMLGQRLDESIRQALEVDCNTWIAAADYYVDEATDAANYEILEQEERASEDWLANHSMDDDGRARCSFHFCHKLFKDESFLRKHLLKKHDAYNQAERAKCHDSYMMSIWEKAPLRPGVPSVLVDCGKQFGKVDSLLSGGPEPRAMDPEPALWERKQQQDKMRMERSELRATRHRPEFDRKKEQGPMSSGGGPPPTTMTPRSGGGRSFVDVDDMKEETVEVSFEQVQLPVADATKKKKKKKRKLL
mmetsp:Transcript_6907/g.14108  ORF Transcript_6907/g.14108 Transcript_6907/m.14108 type:complete len:1061 (-) Transcript_6907:228-3410(-)